VHFCSAFWHSQGCFLLFSKIIPSYLIFLLEQDLAFNATFHIRFNRLWLSTFIFYFLLTHKRFDFFLIFFFKTFLFCDLIHDPIRDPVRSDLVRSGFCRRHLKCISLPLKQYFSCCLLHFIISPLRHFTILGQKNIQNMLHYYTVEQGYNTDWRGARKWPHKTNQTLPCLRAKLENLVNVITCHFFHFNHFNGFACVVYVFRAHIIQSIRCKMDFKN